MISQVERQVAQAQERSNAATELVARLERIDVEAQSPGGEIKVRVDSSGRLLGVHIAGTAVRLGSSRLEELIMDAVGRAQKDAAREAVRLSEELVGEGLATQLTGEYEARIGSLDEEPNSENDGFLRPRGGLLGGR